jgi:uncharacterized protein
MPGSTGDVPFAGALRNSAKLRVMPALSLSRILISGASGPIGAALVPSFRSKGCQVVRLVRGPAKGDDEISWNTSQPLAPESVSGLDAVIHLAGESIVGRWTGAKKKLILDSRVQGTRNLAEALAKTSQKPKVLITSSAIGYYGNRGDEVLNEQSASGNDFLSEVCRQWEAASQPAAQAGIRTAQVRTGVVLSPDGGALQKMLPPFRFGVGGNMGNGRQWWSWIHIQDWVGAVHHILRNEVLLGPVNLVAPKPVKNAEFTKTLASVLKRPSIFPMPASAARLMFGQMADELLLASQRVEPGKLIASGYPFQYPDLRNALEAILKK